MLLLTAELTGPVTHTTLTIEAKLCVTGKLRKGGLGHDPIKNSGLQSQNDQTAIAFLLQ